MWSVAEITAGLIVACIPAARLFVLRYWPRVWSTHRSHRSHHPHRPHRPRRPASTSWPLPSKESTLFQAGSYRSSFGHKLQNLALDKNRRYSMRVTVTSTGRFGSQSETSYFDRTAEEEDTRISEVPKPGRVRLKPSREYLGEPERLMVDGQQGQRQRGIVVTQAVSVVHSDLPGPSRSRSLDAASELDGKDSQERLTG